MSSPWTIAVYIGIGFVLGALVTALRMCRKGKLEHSLAATNSLLAAVESRELDSALASWCVDGMRVTASWKPKQAYAVHLDFCCALRNIKAALKHRRVTSLTLKWEEDGLARHYIATKDRL